MPRVTRAALRSNVVALDEVEVATSLPVTPRKERAPLGEVAGNTVDPATASSNTDDTKPKKKRPAKSKPRQGARGAKKADVISREEVLEDDSHSATSSAVEDACEELRNDPEGDTPEAREKPAFAKIIVASPHLVLVDEPLGPSASVVKAASHELPHAITTHISSATHNTEPVTDQKDQKDKNNDDDSFVNVIQTRTPLKMSQNEAAPLLEEEIIPLESEPHDITICPSENQTEAKEDSFVNQIVTSSPVKPALRIEDSVEAIDAFEDEIEKIGEQLPAIDNAVSSAKAKKQQTGTRSSPRKKRIVGVTPTAKGKAGSHHPVSRVQNTTANNTANPNLASGPNPIRSKVTTRISSIHKAPFKPQKSSKPPTTSNFELPGDAVARKLKEQHDARLASEGEGAMKPQKTEIKAVQPVKSTKPPTRPSFELPGEAVARKLKEQREERLKLQEGCEAESKKKEFKARPVRHSQAPVVKPTAASRARMSLAVGETVETKPSKPRMSNAQPGSSVRRPVSKAQSDASKRLSTLSVAKRMSTATNNPSARPSLAGTSTSRMSTATLSQRTTSNCKGAHQTARGKEVFERGKTAKDELEKARKEKEEAAKRARIEAAERGRMASRQWAEKQKVRKASAEKAGGQEPVAVAIAA